jgi:hypothetical protein
MKENSTRFGPQTGLVMRIGTTDGVVDGGLQPSMLPAGGWIAGQAAELLAPGEPPGVAAGAGDEPALHAAATSTTQSVSRASRPARIEVGEDMDRSVALDPGRRRRGG